MTTHQMKHKTLMELRREISHRRPIFNRQEHWRLKRIAASWRRPKGIDNPMAHHFKGFPPVVKVGYRGPTAVRGLHPSGLHDVVVQTEQDLAALSPRYHAVRIAARVGERRRREIAERGKQLGLHILNPPRSAEQ